VQVRTHCADSLYTALLTAEALGPDAFAPGEFLIEFFQHSCSLFLCCINAYELFQMLTSTAPALHLHRLHGAVELQKSRLLAPRSRPHSKLSFLLPLL
jgi:hypothetical protein